MELMEQHSKKEGRMVCKLQNCTKKIHSKGVCNMHYLRFWRYGSFDLGEYRVEHDKEFIRERHRLEMRRWRLNNKEKSYFQRHEYKMRKKNATGTHTLNQWLELKAFYNFMCLCCKQFEPNIKLTEDHILPLSMGGTDGIENIQPLCGSCNTKKLIKTTDFRPVGANLNFRVRGA